MFSWFGHQSRFVLPAKVECITGHFPAVSSVFASISLSKRSSAFSGSVYNDHQCFESDPGRRAKVGATTRAGHANVCRRRGTLHNLPLEFTALGNQVISCLLASASYLLLIVAPRCTYNQFVG